MEEIMKRRSILLKSAMTLALASTMLIPVGLMASSGTAGASGAVKVFMIPKFTGIAPFTDAAKGCKTEGQKIGLNCLYGGPTTGSARDQGTLINNAVSAGDRGSFISTDDIV